MIKLSSEKRKGVVEPFTEEAVENQRRRGSRSKC
jgi:hypothetical protein